MGIFYIIHRPVPFYSIVQLAMSYENRVLTASALETFAPLHWKVPLEKPSPLETYIFRTLNGISSGLNDIFRTLNGISNGFNGAFQWR